jgi:hypothetical protein
MSDKEKEPLRSLHYWQQRATEAQEKLEQARTREKQLLEALREAEHELTTLHGLTAVDGLKAYSEAQRAGCDPHGAWDCFVESTWKLDTSKTLNKINKLLEE